MKNKVILIKKYENRRLYDTVNSRYVNLEDVARLLQQGESVRVVDALSGEDITRVVLTQIIVEDAKTPDSTFPIEMLKQMVVASGRATQAGAFKYMQSLLDVYEKSYRAMAPPFPFPQPPPMPGVDSQPRPGSSGQQTTVTNQPPDANMEELRQRVAELETLVAGTAAKGGRKRPAAKRKPVPE